MSKSFNCETGAHDKCKPPSETLLSRLPAHLQAEARSFECSCPCHKKTSRVSAPPLDAPGYNRYPGQQGLNRRNNAIRNYVSNGPARANARRILMEEFGYTTEDLMKLSNRRSRMEGSMFRPGVRVVSSGRWGSIVIAHKDAEFPGAKVLSVGAKAARYYVPVIAEGDFREEEHPRDEGGKFTSAEAHEALTSAGYKRDDTPLSSQGNPTDDDHSIRYKHDNGTWADLTKVKGEDPSLSIHSPSGRTITHTDSKGEKHPYGITNTEYDDHPITTEDAKAYVQRGATFQQKVRKKKDSFSEQDAHQALKDAGYTDDPDHPDNYQSGDYYAKMFKHPNGSSAMVHKGPGGMSVQVTDPSGKPIKPGGPRGTNQYLQTGDPDTLRDYVQRGAPPEESKPTESKDEVDWDDPGKVWDAATKLPDFEQIWKDRTEDSGGGDGGDDDFGFDETQDAVTQDLLEAMGVNEDDPDYQKKYDAMAENVINGMT